MPKLAWRFQVLGCLLRGDAPRRLAEYLESAETPPEPEPAAQGQLDTPVDGAEIERGKAGQNAINHSCRVWVVGLSLKATRRARLSEEKHYC